MNVNLEIRHLKLLAAIAEEESVTGAGKRLHLTQSALSHQLRDAEEKLGTPLFLRLGKRMALTAAGKKLLECAHRILHQLHEAESQVQDMNGGLQGVIRLSTECYTCYHWLPPVLERFHMRYPKVELCIDMEATHSPADRLLEGKLDVAVMSSPPPNKNLHLSPLGEDELMLVMSPRHPLAARRTIKPQDLARETLLIYPPREESTLLNKVMKPAGLEPFRVMEIPLTEAILEMAAAQTGISLMAQWAAAPYVRSGRIVARSLCDSGFHRQWYAVTLSCQPMKAYLREFLSLLAGDCSKYMRRFSASVAAS
ncbi:MAG TPA: LysR substrate-binding domain-containing protein [Terriglobales bacterium]|nr:LysR substrate-binding domain-containing protein [Terriglobales bacterium]